MGVCGSTDEKNEIKVNKRGKKNSSSETGTDSNYNNQDYLIPLSSVCHDDITKKYKLNQDVIGEGASGTVCLAYDKSNNVYAIKRINKTKIEDKSLLKNEAEIALSLDYAHIIKTYEVYEDLKFISFVMELADGGDLFDFITKSPDGYLDDINALDCIIQILETLDYLHNEKYIVHRDLKPENFLVTIVKSKPFIKLIDFGFAINIKENQKLTQYLGTPLYTAPEIVEKEPYNEKVDIWSAGIVLFNMVTGCQVFNDHSPTSIEDQIIYNSIPFSKIDNEDIRELCFNMLEKDPYVRYDAEKALRKAKKIKKNYLLSEFKKLEKNGKVTIQELKEVYQLPLKNDGGGEEIDFDKFEKIMENPEEFETNV
jgi:calcium-dependent protein kinase